MFWDPLCLLGFVLLVLYSAAQHEAVIKRSRMAIMCMGEFLNDRAAGKRRKFRLQRKFRRVEISHPVHLCWASTYYPDAKTVMVCRRPARQKSRACTRQVIYDLSQISCNLYLLSKEGPYRCPRSPRLHADVILDHFLDLGGKVALEETLDMHKDDQHM